MGKIELTVLKYSVEGAVARVCMNLPPVNALGEDFLVNFQSVLEDIEQNREVRAVVIESAVPGFFSAGDDVSSMEDIDQELADLLPQAHALLNRLEALPLPVIASINGHALGGGLELALACDFRIMAADSGHLGLPEVRLGLIPSLGGTQRLPQVVGKTRAMEMMIRGWLLTSQEGLDAGLLNQVVAGDKLEEKVMDLAGRLARQATGAIGRIKACVNAGLWHGPEAGLAMEVKAFGENIQTADAKEGVRAFLENRKPEFGRS